MGKGVGKVTRRRKNEITEKRKKERMDLDDSLSVKNSRTLKFTGL